VSTSGSTITVPHGQSVTTSLTLSRLQPGTAVSAVCYNLPAFGYCNYSSGTLTVSTSSNTPTGTYRVLIVCSTSGALSSSDRPVGMTVLCSLLGFPIGLLVLRRGRRFQPYGLSLLLGALLLTAAIGCGDGSNQNSPVVPAQASTTVMLTVQ
jgi:hypothetical protein